MPKKSEAGVCGKCRGELPKPRRIFMFISTQSGVEGDTEVFPTYDGARKRWRKFAKDEGATYDRSTGDYDWGESDSVAWIAEVEVPPGSAPPRMVTE